MEMSLLSASSAHRWLKCTPSPVLELQFEEQSSAFADEGTAAHALAEYKLRRYLGQECERPESEYENEEMEGVPRDTWNTRQNYYLKRRPSAKTR